MRLVSLYENNCEVTAGMKFRPFDQLFTGDGGQLVLVFMDGRIELGRNSSLRILNDPVTGKPAFHLLEGRMRVRAGTAPVQVLTAYGQAFVEKSCADIILTKQNALMVAREGSPIEIHTFKVSLDAGLNQYALLTTEGEVVITKFATDRAFSDTPHGKRMLAATETFSETTILPTP